jgi:hypothetical protein
MKPACLVVVGSALGLAAPALAAPLATSDSDCPSAADVTARLAGLWSGDNPASAAAHIRVELGQMTVDLVSEGEPAVSRILPAEPDCESRAQAAALVIAAWLDSRPSGPLGEVEPATSPPLERAGLRAPEAIEQPASPAPPRVFLGIGGLASVDARGAGAVLSAEAAWLRLSGRVGLGAGLSLPLPREMAVGQGKARWWRPVLALALRVPLTEGTWAFDAGVGPAFGLLVVAGSGFPQNHTDAVGSWGATAVLRLARRSRGRAYWADLRGLLWPAAQNIRNDVPGAAPYLEAVPRIEAQLGLGFSFAVF